MAHFKTQKILTHEGALLMLQAAMAAAGEMGQPQCISIVDAGGEVIVELRMTGAKFLSLKSARAKAVTAANNRRPSEKIPDHVRPMIAAATQGQVTALHGGLPIIIERQCLGGIGVGSGSSDQDVAVAKAALEAIGANVT